MYKKDIRKAIAGVTQNKRIRAIALEVIGDRASVKISGSSQLLYGVPVVGGDIVAGQEVYVDYTTGQPVVHSYTKADLSDVSVSRVKTRVIIPDSDVPNSSAGHTHIQSQITDLVHDATKIRGRTVTTGSPTDGDTFLWSESGGSWIYGSGGEVEEAPIDGKQYARSSGSWVEVEAGGSSGSLQITTDIDGKIIMSVFDVLTTGSSPIKIYNASNVGRKLLGAFISVDTPPTSGSVVVDVQKNGTTIFSAGEKPFISSGSYTGSSYALDIVNWDIGEYLSLIIDETDGVASELVVQILYQVENIVVDYSGIVLTGASFDVQEQDFFSIEGIITTGSSPFLIYNTSGSPLTINKIFGSVGTPSGGTNIVVDVLKNSSSIFTSGSNMLQIASGSYTGETTSILDTEWLPGEAITIDVKDAGTNAEDLVVQVIYTKGIKGSSGAVTDHNDLTSIGVNTHDQIDAALLRLANTSGSNTGDQDLSLYLTDAVSDGKTYGRKDGSWAQIISSGSGGGIEEAPIDGKPYARQNAGWVIASGGSGVEPAYYTFDINIPPESPSSYDDEFNEATLDAKWTPTTGTQTSISYSQNDATPRYDLNRIPGQILLQACALTQTVDLSSDFTCIVKVNPGFSKSVNESYFALKFIKDSTHEYVLRCGRYNSTSEGVRTVYNNGSGAAEGINALTSNFQYLAFSFDVSEHNVYAACSSDGIVWQQIESRVLSNISDFDYVTLSQESTGAPNPITAIDFIRFNSTVYEPKIGGQEIPVGSQGGCPETHTPVSGYYLTGYDADTGLFTSGSVASGASALSDLVDVAISGSPTDGQVLAYSSGSTAWMPQTINSIYPAFTKPPKLSEWTWLNQGIATAVDTDMGIHLFAPALAGDQLRVLYMNMPTPPFTITAGIIVSLINVNYQQAGIVLFDSVSGKLVTMIRGQTGTIIYLQKFNSVTSWNSDYKNVAIGAPGSMCYFRITDDNTNRIYYYSADGLSWVQLHSVIRTDFLTPNKIGFYVNSNNATYGCGIHLLSWKQT